MNQSTYNTLKSFIWGIANDCLVDVYDVGDYRKIILPMFVIRRFDAVLEPKHEEVMKAKERFINSAGEDIKSYFSDRIAVDKAVKLIMDNVLEKQA